MNQEFEEILNRLKDIENNVKENHDMLESIQRRAKLAILFSALKWFIILGFTFGVFYYTKPYLEKTLELYDQVNSLTSQSKQAGTLIEGLKNLLQ